MTKLLSDIDISRSIVVASFLELESAARSSFQDENPQIGQGNHSVGNTMSPHINPRSNESLASGSTPLTPDYGSDTAYENSEIGTSSYGRDNISEAGTEDLSLDEDLTGPLEKLVKHGVSNIDEGLLMGNAILEQVEGYSRNTVHAREINKVIMGGEKNGSGGDYLSDREHGKLILNSEKLSNGSPGNDGSSLRRGVSLDMGFSNSLADSHLSPSSDINLVLPLGQQQNMNRVLISMQRRLGTAKTDMEDLISRLNQEIAVKGYLMTKDDKQEKESPKTSAIEEKDQLLQELDDTKNKLEQLLKKHQELEVKSKAYVKVLVKEVKSLRSSQAELKQQLNQSLIGQSDAEILKINSEKKDIDAFVADDFKLIGYDPQQKIEMKMAV